MKKAAKVLYMISIILSAVGIFFFIIFAVVSAAMSVELISDMLNNAKDSAITSYLPSLTTIDAETLKLVLVTTLSVMIATNIGVLVVAILAYNSLDKEKPSLGLHIAIIAIGVFAGSLTALLGGIFATVTLNGENTAAEKEEAEKDVVTIREPKKPPEE